MNNPLGQSQAPYSSVALGHASVVDEGPGALLGRIIDGDPLEVRTLVHRRMAERFLVWDEESVCLRAFALCAHKAVQMRRRRLDRDWILVWVDRAIDQLALRGESMAGGGQPSAFEIFGLPLDFDPEAVARACLALNRMDELERRCFRLILIENRNLDEVARELGKDGGTVGRAARRALDRFYGCLVTPKAKSHDL